MLLYFSESLIFKKGWKNNLACILRSRSDFEKHLLYLIYLATNTKNNKNILFFSKAYNQLISKFLFYFETKNIFWTAEFKIIFTILFYLHIKDICNHYYYILQNILGKFFRLTSAHFYDTHYLFFDSILLSSDSTYSGGFKTSPTMFSSVFQSSISRLLLLLI